MEIKNNLKEIRMREYLMGCREFAKMLDVPLSTYSQWENSVSNPPLLKAFGISKKLNRQIGEVWYVE